jgi:hypothetical protein
MKAIQIMMFLIIFNFSISMISAINIYNLEEYEQQGEMIDEFGERIDEDTFETSGASAKGLFDFFMSHIIVISLSATIGIFAGFSDKYIGSGISGLDSFLYSLFTGIFLTTTWQSSEIFLSLGSNNYGVYIIVIAFALISSVVFVIALYQIASKGGWRSFE